MKGICSRIEPYIYGIAISGIYCDNRTVNSAVSHAVQSGQSEYISTRNKAIYRSSQEIGRINKSTIGTASLRPYSRQYGAARSFGCRTQEGHRAGGEYNGWIASSGYDRWDSRLYNDLRRRKRS